MLSRSDLITDTMDRTMKGSIAPCSSALSPEFGRSIETARAPLIDTSPLKGFTPEFFRQISPNAVPKFSNSQIEGISKNLETCKQIRPAQFERFPRETAGSFSGACLSEFKVPVIYLLTAEHLKSMMEFGLQGFTAKHFYLVVKRIGDKLSIP